MTHTSFSDSEVLGRFTCKDPSDIDAVLSGLKFNAERLLELSNSNPEAFIGREVELYQIMNAMQLVTGRFAKVAPPKRLGSPLSLVRLPDERITDSRDGGGGK